MHFASLKQMDKNAKEPEDRLLSVFAFNYSTNMESNQKKVEVCFSPAIFNCYENSEAIVVVVDILRATSAICAAFINGAEAVIPVGTIEEARSYKQNGYLVAAERDGIILDFADFGNSPFNFTSTQVGGKTVAYSTTNGTQAIQMASSCYGVVVGAYLNITALTQWLISQKRNIIILCAGWKNKFSLEDSVFAGALTDKLIESTYFNTNCDSALAAIDLWNIAKTDLSGYMNKAAQRFRLKSNGLDDCIDYCHTLDLTNIVPFYDSKKLVGIQVAEAAYS